MVVGPRWPSGKCQGQLRRPGGAARDTARRLREAQRLPRLLRRGDEGHNAAPTDCITQIHAILGRKPPPHPHLSVIAATWQDPLRLDLPIVGRRIESGLYAVSLKRGDECHVEFGRQRCDGQACTLVFLAPGQALIPLSEEGDPRAEEGEGWTIVFHPDLLRGTPLGESMHRYRFFGYAAREALHLTKDEGALLSALARRLDAARGDEWWAAAGTAASRQSSSWRGRIVGLSCAHSLLSASRPTSQRDGERWGPEPAVGRC